MVIFAAASRRYEYAQGDKLGELHLNQHLTWLKLVLCRIKQGKG